jgi:hypothetical protein
MKYWVDPPEGWRWGFPKVWDDEEWPDLHTFLVLSGYPDTDMTMHTRMWEYTEEDV